MNFTDLIKVAEKRLKRIELSLAFDVLAVDMKKVDKRRYRSYAKIRVSEYLADGEEIEVHCSVMPQKNSWEDGAPYPWPEWLCLKVDRVGPDCVRFFVPLRGSHPMPVGDFVRAVVMGHIREPVNTAR